MKKFLKLFVTLNLCFMCTILAFGCKDTTDTVKIYMPDGTPSLSMACLLDSNKQFEGYQTSYNVVQASAIQTVFSANDADLAIMPTISAASLFKGGADIKLISTNVFGNLYIVGVNSNADSLDDLVGKVVYTTTGTTIALLEYLLTESNINYIEGNEVVENKVALSSKTDGSEIIPLLKTASGEAFGVLGEPQVTKALSLIGAKGKICINLQTVYTTLSGFEGYPQASLISTGTFCNENKEYIDKLLVELDKNLAYLNANYQQIPTVMAQYNSNLKNMTFTLSTIENCNFDIKSASEVKESVKSYCKQLKNIDLADEFFYV